MLHKMWRYIHRTRDRSSPPDMSLTWRSNTIRKFNSTSSFSPHGISFPITKTEGPQGTNHLVHLQQPLSGSDTCWSNAIFSPHTKSSMFCIAHWILEYCALKFFALYIRLRHDLYVQLIPKKTRQESGHSSFHHGNLLSEPRLALRYLMGSTLTEIFTSSSPTAHKYTIAAMLLLLYTMLGNSLTYDTGHDILISLNSISRSNSRLGLIFEIDPGHVQD